MRASAALQFILVYEKERARVCRGRSLTTLFHIHQHQDWHREGEKFACSGGKNVVLVWSLEEEEDDTAIRQNSTDRQDKPHMPRVSVFADYTVSSAKAESQEEWVVDSARWYVVLFHLRSLKYVV